MHQEGLVAVNSEKGQNLPALRRAKVNTQAPQASWITLDKQRKYVGLLDRQELGRVEFLQLV